MPNKPRIQQLIEQMTPVQKTMVETNARIFIDGKVVKAKTYMELAFLDAEIDKFLTSDNIVSEAIGYVISAHIMKRGAEIREQNPKDWGNKAPLVFQTPIFDENGKPRFVAEHGGQVLRYFA